MRMVEWLELVLVVEELLVVEEVLVVEELLVVEKVLVVEELLVVVELLLVEELLVVEDRSREKPCSPPGEGRVEGRPCSLQQGLKGLLYCNYRVRNGMNKVGGDSHVSV